MGIKTIVGDCREVLKGMPSESVACIVTSPPYFGLRDYDAPGQIGAEDSPEEYVAELVAALREARRVLWNEGTLWLNIGDSYAGSWGASGHKGSSYNDVAQSRNKIVNHQKRARRSHPGFKPKDRMMIPARVALALQADGWWLRDEIVWHKPNPMPASVEDRTTPAHEMVYMLTKSKRYHYDMDAIKEDAGHWPGHDDRKQGGFAGKGATPGTGQRAFRAIREKRQPRSVWTIPSKPFFGEHFATFPPALAERCILAGCPKGATVLDPFGGAGTTGLVADRLGRDAVLIEINPRFAAMGTDRICGDAPLFVVADDTVEAAAG